MYRLNDKLIATQNYIDNIVLKSTHIIVFYVVNNELR